MEQNLIRLSDDATSKLVETKTKRSILLLKVPNLNLYVISDCRNFGSNWIEVNYCNKVYTTKYLLGHNEDLFSGIARKFAQDIIERNDKEKPKLDELDVDDLNARRIVLSIALRNTDPGEIRDIGLHLREF